MKKLTITSLVLAIAFTVIGCGSGDSTEDMKPKEAPPLPSSKAEAKGGAVAPTDLAPAPDGVKTGIPK